MAISETIYLYYFDLKSSQTIVPSLFMDFYLQFHGFGENPMKIIIKRTKMWTQNYSAVFFNIGKLKTKHIEFRK